MTKLKFIFLTLFLMGCNGTSCVPNPDQIRACKDACVPHSVKYVKTDIGCICNDF